MKLLIGRKTLDGKDYKSPFWIITQENFKRYFSNRTDFDVLAIFNNDNTIQGKALSVDDAIATIHMCFVDEFIPGIRIPIKGKYGELLGYQVARLRFGKVLSTKSEDIEWLENNPDYETKKE